MTNGFRIEHQCPQCGAPAVLEETDRLFACGYCRIKSCLVQRDVFRYVLPDRAPAGQDLFFLPYWHFKGMLFTCAGHDIHDRFIDVSAQAVRSPYFPVSLGFRSQALKLRFLSPETRGRFLKPTRDADATLGTFFKNQAKRKMRGPVHYQSHIGETLSLIYAPFYSDNGIYDAVVDQRISTSSLEELAQDMTFDERPQQGVQFIPALCPSCGWELNGGRDAIVLTCGNCDSAWKPGPAGLKRLKYGHMPDRAADNGAYLPFWCIRAATAGVPLDSYADLVKAANLPVVPQKGWDEIDFRFWVPAFKTRPRAFMRLSCNMTLAQPRERLQPTLPKARLLPVTLPVLEAVECLKITLASFIKPVENFFPRLPEIEITPKSFLLAYLPFRESQHEFVHTRLDLAVNKNALSLAQNL